MTVAPLALGDEVTEWTLSVLASGSDAVDGLSLGARAGATARFDIGIDMPEPPSPPGDRWVRLFATASTGRPEYRELDRSYVEPADNQAWNSSLRSGRAVPEITLTWSAPASTSRVYELVHENDLIDLQTSTRLTLRCSDKVCPLTLRSYVRVGTVPDAPRRLSALPGLADGTVTLQWEPPATDGGLPLRTYSVWRAEIGRDAELIATTRLSTFTDQRRELGEAPVYTVRAENANGPSNASEPAVGIGTGRERTLTPDTNASTWMPIGSAVVTTANIPRIIPADTWIGIGPSPDDPRSTEVSASADGETRRAGLFTAGAPAPSARLDNETLASTVPLAEVSAGVWSSPSGEVILGASIATDAVTRSEYLALTP